MDSLAAKNLDLFSHRIWLRSVVRSRLGEVDLVDDILNETFSAALEHVKLGRVIEELGPWLYRVAIRKVLQFRRSQGRYRNFKHRLAENQVCKVRAEPNPIEILVGKEQAGLVQQAMKRLNGKDAEILTLKYVHQWNYQTISQNLGIKESKIANRLRVARKRLKKLLVEYGLDSTDSSNS